MANQSKKVQQLIDELIEREGGYVNNPNDSGGETNYGITKAEARRNGYLGAMELMPRSVAERIYRTKYWELPAFDRVFTLSPSIAEELMDTGVHCGVAKASEFLQMSLNSFNRQGKDYPDISEDGIIGTRTLNALQAFLRVRGAFGEVVMLRALNSLQGTHYINLTRRRVKDEDFIYGWFSHRVVMA
jgi:lysozyme family protein